MIQNMNISLSQEIETLIRQHMTHGCAGSPESVILKALHALQQLETMQLSPDKSLPHGPEEPTRIADVPAGESPLVQWLQETAGPRVGLEEVRRRLSGIPGAMSDTIREEREDRI